ncbi:Coenzyme A disulfide reductase [Rubripirellula lacrimiformis]|uniref:Coenzyme A disulfide reductase n=1 Tax=Rubripirellula lacrimiformis TaxID=1930273 RepID=A0A517NKA6_9BACT|nr:FAD-dependent oxidoreductase [Rubripirellula lacrimiformis]QDT07578.1 Coenzyme A disulfide reductase [Rubripirellula lacrimiformis]
MKIIVIGGVAGGASAAARARRMSEDAEIVVFERGLYPSFANCGLPYYVGGEIASRDKLLVAPIEMLRQRHRLDVRVQSEVTRIDRDKAVVHVHDAAQNRDYTETYDKLIIATGASPFRPPIPGIDSDRVLELRDLPDADRMHTAATSGAKHAVIVGAGFIGIEVAENLVRRDIEVTIVELAEQVLPPWDAEMVQPIEDHLRQQGVRLRLSESATAFAETPSGIDVTLKSGETVQADFAVVCIGVRPESRLSLEAGLEIGPRGGVIVNDSMQTSDPNIYAVGDVVEVQDFVAKQPTQIPLAGPANRQGRIAADHIFGKPATYRGTQGTAIVGVFGKTAAMTGQSEKQLIRNQVPYEKIYIHPSDHAGYYPGATAMTLKLIFAPHDGAILGAQCVGTNGVDKRIDVLAIAIQAGLTVFDLEETELCYAPQYGHAKDPINMAGFVASNVIRKDHPIVHVDAIEQADDSETFVLDVRTTAEFAGGHIQGATNIPIEELRDRLDEVPTDKQIVAYCKVGQRGYLATRALLQNGYRVVNLSGGYTTWQRRHQPDTSAGS